MKNYKYVFRILLITITGAALIIFFIFYLFQYNSQQNNLGCGTKSQPVFFCGTSTAPLTEDASKGKAFFYSNCAACHKLDAKCTGPALRDTDSITLTKWLSVKNQKINERKINKLSIDYHRSMWGKTITEEDIKNLYAYTSRTCTMN